VESGIAELNPFDRFQFERLGYFCIDPESTQEKLVINRSVELRGDWKKYQDK
jgi:glutaminyl-tRNA synthetase